MILTLEARQKLAATIKELQSDRNDYLIDIREAISESTAQINRWTEAAESLEVGIEALQAQIAEYDALVALIDSRIQAALAPKWLGERPQETSAFR